MSTFGNDVPLLLDEFRTLETELHQPETRRDRKRMEMLLHPDFVEFGQSGRQYSRADILKEFGTNRACPPIHSCHFELIVLSKDLVLLTYFSAHVDAGGNLHRHALRSSLWVNTEVGWQIRFHQGTAATHALCDHDRLVG